MFGIKASPEGLPPGLPPPLRHSLACYPVVILLIPVKPHACDPVRCTRPGPARTLPQSPVWFGFSRSACRGQTSLYRPDCKYSGLCGPCFRVTASGAPADHPPPQPVGARRSPRLQLGFADGHWIYDLTHVPPGMSCCSPIGLLPNPSKMQSQSKPGGLCKARRGAGSGPRHLHPVPARTSSVRGWETSRLPKCFVICS